MNKTYTLERNDKLGFYQIGEQKFHNRSEERRVGKECA
jgi:hypothetical protein